MKRLTVENQGLRAEQPPTSGLQGLEPYECQEEPLPSLVPVRGLQAQDLEGHPVGPFLSANSKALTWDLGTGPSCCV